MRKVDLAIIGGGPAGLAAALAAKEAGCTDILILERGPQLGGILRQCIHNGFGLHTFREELTGPEYAQRYIDRVRAAGIPCACNTMVIDLTAERVLTCVSRERGLEHIQAGAVLLAMGCRERPRGALATPGWRCAGIYTAGTAQRFVNLEGLVPGKHVVILGSGDIGLIMARRMTFIGAKVEACVELMPYSSGLKRNIVQCLDDFSIPLLLNHTVVDIHGRERLTGVTIAKVYEHLKPIPGTEREIPCDTLLLSVGLLPENELSGMAGVELSPATGGAVVNDRYETSVPGIFSCGNVLHVHDLVDFVSLEAQSAGRSAARFALGLLPKAGRQLPVTAGFGVSGLVPQLVSASPEADIPLMFRPRGVYKNAAITVEAGGALLLERKARILTPGEMVRLTLSASDVRRAGNADEIRISIVEEAQA